jgi:TolB-like protein/Tfp pilus assembly protein PilF
MFTDLVGYSALSQSNEALALELLDEHRRILRPIFVKYQGDEIETAGDAFFVEFNSAVEAVNCAIEIQSTLYERNKTADPSRRIVLRVGLHIGDVVHMDQHVHGDGVNIAARLEPLAQPGGICISEDVARQVRNKIKYAVVKAGAERLKNISMPMDVYCIALPWLRAGLSKKASGKQRRSVAMLAVIGVLLVVAAILFFSPRNSVKASSTVKHRLAVLPLKNISNDSRDEYFADGLTEELISNIARIGGLSVIARTSMMKYKNTDKDVSQIGNELRVGTVLEGSVRLMNKKARITVQLVDVEKQENLWSEDYDRDITDIFSIQTEIATSIAKELKLRLVEADASRMNNAVTESIDAYQEYLAGKHFVNQRTSESLKTGITHLENAIALDPSFILPYPALAYAYTLIGVAGYGGADRKTADEKARLAITKALELDSTNAESHAASAYAKFRIDWDWDGAEREFRKAIDLKPGYATAHEWYGLYLAVRGRLDEALREMKIAQELDPLSPSVNTGIARIYFFRDEHKESLEQIRKTLKIDPSYAEAHFTAGMTYNKLNQLEAAEREFRKAVELSGRRPVMLALQGVNFVEMGRRSEAMALLKELETPPMNDDKLYAIATIKISLGGFEENFSILEKLAREKYGIMIYLKVQREYFNYENHPRFIQLVKEIGL